jgi:hypothetical protein
MTLTPRHIAIKALDKKTDSNEKKTDNLSKATISRNRHSHSESRRSLHFRLEPS